jgi:hypothetical protein
MTNVTFTSNSAPYGKDIASYPVKIVDVDSKSTDIHLTGVVSGQVVSKELKFVIMDYDNQTSSKLNGGKVSISALSNGASVLGENSASIVSGNYQVSNYRCCYIQCDYFLCQTWIK